MAANRNDRLLAYDIGGSHVAAGLCQLEPLTVGRIAIAPLVDTISSEAFLDLLQNLGQQLIDGEEAAGASLAFPGPFDYSAGVSRMEHKLGALYGVDLRVAIAMRMGWSPERIRFLNDAEAALLGEASAGVAEGAARAVGIMLGTGIGSAFIRDGNLLTESEGVPPGGEIWNLPFLDGIVEDLLSSRAIESDYFARTGRQQSAAFIASVASGTGANADARAVFEAFGCHLGQVISTILAPFSPEIVVLGGGISRASDLFLPAAKSQLNGLGIRLVPSVLFESAPLLGAAAYWRDCFFGSSVRHTGIGRPSGLD